MRAGLVGSIVALIVVTGAVVSRLGWIGLVIGPLLFLTLVAAEIGFLWLWIEYRRLTWLGLLAGIIHERDGHVGGSPSPYPLPLWGRGNGSWPPLPREGEGRGEGAAAVRELFGLGIASIAVLSVTLCGMWGCSAENIVFAALAGWLVAVGVVLLKRVVWRALGRR